MPRRDTRLQAQGAEFLVLAQLLMDGLQAYKTYVNYPGYDVIVTNPEQGITARIQVKSRYGTRQGFPLKNFDTDFVVFVAIHPRGHHNPLVAPEVYVLPIEVVLTHKQPHSYGEAVRLSRLPDAQQFRDNWGLVRRFLGYQL